MYCVAGSQRHVRPAPAKGRGALSRQKQIHSFEKISQNNPQPNTTPLQLPGGEYWWLGSSSNDAVIYGNTFVLSRPKIGGPGLVPASREVFIERYSPRPKAPLTRQAPRQPMGLSTLSGMVVIDTECEEVFAPNTTDTSIIYLGSNQGSVPAETAFGKHPRRTRRMRFTCNLCGETNEKDVNPRAWTEGSVFARCDSCEAVHKLKDNLKIFHELKGHVFPPRDMRASFPAVQEILNRIEAKRINGGFLDN